MPELPTVKLLLSNSGLNVSGEIVLDIFSPNIIYIPISIERDEHGNQIPAQGTINHVKQKILELGFLAEFIIKDLGLREIESAIFALISQIHPNVFVNAFTSSRGRSIDVWLENSVELNTQSVSHIRTKIETLISPFELKLNALSLLSEVNTPSLTACLSMIRILAPVELDFLADLLRKDGFTLPSHTWLSHRMDALRKKSLVARLKDGKYALTLTGLRVLGTSKNRKSADIRRMLALARRGG